MYRQNEQHYDTSGDKTPTCYDATIAAEFSHGSDQVADSARKDLRATDEETVLIWQIQTRGARPPLWPIALQVAIVNAYDASSLRYTIVIGGLHDVIRMPGHARLVAGYVIPRKENAIARDNFARLEQHYITHDDLLYVNLLFPAVTQDPDKLTPRVLAPSGLFQPSFPFPVVSRTNQDDEEDSSNGSNAPDPGQ